VLAFGGMYGGGGGGMYGSARVARSSVPDTGPAARTQVQLGPDGRPIPKSKWESLCQA
jgi:hypothetical protein